MRRMPAATIRPNSVRRASVVIVSGKEKLGEVFVGISFSPVRS